MLKRHSAVLFVCVSLLMAAAAHAQVLTYTQSIFNSTSGPTASVMSSDGAFLYVTKGNSLSVFARDAATGQLTFVQELRQGFFGIDGLLLPLAIAIAPGDEHIYVADAQGVATFSRDAIEGTLTFEDLLASDAGNGLTAITAIAVAPDGKHVYTTGFEGLGSLTRLVRNSITGTLTFGDALINGANAPADFLDPQGLTIAEDNTHVYVVLGSSDAIHQFSRNTSTGVLTSIGRVENGVGGVQDLDNPNDIVISSNGLHVYVASGHTRSVTMFTRTPANGQLAYTASYVDGDGLIDGLINVDDIAIADDGSFVYTAATNDDSVTVFARDATTGLLTFGAVRSNTGIGGGLNKPTSVTPSPDGLHLYATAEIDRAITILDAAAAKALFDVIAVHEDLDGHNNAAGLTGVRAATVSGDGRHVYTAGTSDQSVGMFRRNEETGRLNYIGVVDNASEGITDLVGPSDVVVSPDGAHAYASAHTRHVVVEFERDSATGILSHIGIVKNGVDGVQGITNAERLAISPSGRHLAVATLNDTGAIFLRDESTGALSFVQIFPEVGLVNAPFIPDQVRDTAFVPGTPYLAIHGFFRLETYAVGAQTGILTLADDATDITEIALNIHNDVVAAPDAGQIYTDNTSTVSAFTFDSQNGNFFLLAENNGGDTSISAFNSGLSMSPDGRFLFTPATNQGVDAGIGVYQRDAETGLVEGLELFPNGQDNSDGFNFGTHTAVSPDGAHVYLSDPVSNAITVFSVGERSALRGRITSNGSPVTCAVVELTSSSGDIVRTAVTDVNGDYNFTSLAIDVYGVRLFGVGVAPSDRGTLDLTAGVAVERNFVMTAATASGGVSGAVIDTDTNEPLVAARVEAFIGGQPAGITYTCAGGAYEISGLVGKGSTAVDLEYSLVNYDTLSDQVQVAGGAVTPADQTLTKSLDAIGSLTGFVFGETESDDIPLPRAQLILRGPVNVSAEADGTGAYRFDALLAGDYTIRAASVGYRGETFTRGVPAQGVAIRTFRLELPGPDGPPTDVDGDGMVNATDIQFVINAALGLTVPIDGDVDGSGGITAVDVQLVINSALGIL